MGWSEINAAEVHFHVFYATMNRPQMRVTEKQLYQTGYIHLAFSAGSKENVTTLTERLQAAGYEVMSGPRTTGDGYFESLVLDPEGNQVEITI